MCSMPPLTPTEELILDVLAARARLGEYVWTFESRVKRQLESLADRGLVTTMHGIVERSLRASLTDEGAAYAMSDNYKSPLEASIDEKKYWSYQSGVIDGAKHAEVGA